MEYIALFFMILGLLLIAAVLGVYLAGRLEDPPPCYRTNPGPIDQVYNACDHCAWRGECLK